MGDDCSLIFTGDSREIRRVDDTALPRESGIRRVDDTALPRESGSSSPETRNAIALRGVILMDFNVSVLRLALLVSVSGAVGGNLAGLLVYTGSSSLLEFSNLSVSIELVVLSSNR